MPENSLAPLPAPPPSAAAPRPLVLDRLIAADTLIAGAVVVLEGTGFLTGPLDNTVRVAGAAAQLLVVSDTRLEVRLPSAAAFPCVATGAHTLRLTSGTQSVERTVLLRAARRVALAAGESINLPDAAAARCTEFAAPDGVTARYTIAVINTSQSATASSGFQLRAATPRGTAPAAVWATGMGAMPETPVGMRANAGAPGGAPGGALGGTPGGAPGAASTGAEAPAALTPLATSESAHGAHLAREQQREEQRAARQGSVVTAWRTAWRTAAARAVAAGRATTAGRVGAAAASATTVPPGAIVADTPLAVGSIVQRNAVYSSCAAPTRILARVVYAGTRAVVLEDIASATARTMDADYRAVGEEFDAVQYPLLRDNIGDPLALNATMGGDGRVHMLFSPYVNDSAPATHGYVTACNFYPRTEIAASNEQALLYARVPQPGESPSAWRRSMRSTVVHEAKHLASFAERMAANRRFEQPWLEEATARIAEELYGRTFNRSSAASGWRSNTGWIESVHCEVYRCDDRPLVMWKHFPGLHDYFAGADTLSPLGRSWANDVTWYASGWSLVRWAVDHFAEHEGAFLRALVSGQGAAGATGIAALEAHTGRTANLLLADWSLANVVDDRPGFVPARATLSFPSWNVPQMMAGLASLNGARYRAQPFRVRDITGDQQVAVPELRGFSASYLETDVRSGRAQLVELRGAEGGAVPPSIRLAIVRVQ